MLKGYETETPSHEAPYQRSITIKYFGSTQIDQRCSQSVLSWVMAEVKVSHPNFKKATLDCLGGVVTARDVQSSAVIFQHQANFIIKFARSTFQLCTFAYLMRNKKNSRFYCHVFEAVRDTEVQAFFHAIRHSIHEAHTRFSGNDESDSSNLISERSRHRQNSLVSQADSNDAKYDVHYIGKQRVLSPHGTKTLVDEVLQTIRRKQSHRSQSLPEGESVTKSLFYKECHLFISSHFLRIVDINSQVVYLQKPITTVSYCAQGLSHYDYVGIICREVTEGHFYCFIIHRPYPDTVEPLLQSMREAFTIAFESLSQRPVAVCESCPMHQLHSLCYQMEGVTVEMSQSLIHKVVESLPEIEFNWIQKKFQEHKEKDSNIQNIIMVSLLRAVYEKLQLQHTHKEDAQTASYLTVPGESLSANSDGNDNSIKQRTRGMNRFKESLAHSLENLLSRKEKTKIKKRSIGSSARENYRAESQVSPLVSRHAPFTCVSDTHPGDVPDIHTIISPSGRPKSPGSPKEKTAAKIKMMKQAGASQSDTTQDEVPKLDRKPVLRRLDRRQRKQSWRHSMYKRAHETDTVISPLVGGDEVDGLLRSPKRTPKTVLKTKQDYRRMWKEAIEQQIMLNRMQKMNKDFDDESSAAEEKRHKLFYDRKESEHENDELHLHQNLDAILSSRSTFKIQEKDLETIVLQGVPKSRREEVWFTLSAAFKLTSSTSLASTDGSADETDCPHFDVLKEGQTEYHHAIFIDQSRTFPKHPYFKKSSGRGQTALYNVLRAYSVYDREVGYCQGLSFIAGIFIIHCKEEKDAFRLLWHFMMNYNFREHYMPTMAMIQVRLYQLSRLIHDFLPLLYNHLDNLDVPPFLYAAPWMLTMFASKFPLQFVSRVMDFILLNGVHGMFKIVLCLLKHFEQQILSQPDFESTTRFLKDEIPKRVDHIADKLVAEAMTTAVEQQLSVYDVEYNVLKEAMPDDSAEMGELESKLEMQQHQLKELQKTLERERAEKAQLAQKLKQLQQVLSERGLEAYFTENGLILEPQPLLGISGTKHNKEPI